MIHRRSLLGAGAAGLALPAIARAAAYTAMIAKFASDWTAVARRAGITAA